MCTYIYIYTYVIHACMYSCMYVYIYIYIYMYTHICITCVQIDLLTLAVPPSPRKRLVGEFKVRFSRQDFCELHVFRACSILRR